MTTQAQPAPAAPAPAPVYEHIDALQLAFDQIKRLEAIGSNPQLSARNHDYNLAQLWLGLANVLEIRLLRREQAARDAAWNAREDAWIAPEEGEADAGI